MLFFQKISVNTKIGGRSSKMHENSQIFFCDSLSIYEATCSSHNSFEHLVAFSDTLITMYEPTVVITYFTITTSKIPTCTHFTFMLHFLVWHQISNCYELVTTWVTWNVWYVWLLSIYSSLCFVSCISNLSLLANFSLQVLHLKAWNTSSC